MFCMNSFKSGWKYNITGITQQQYILLNRKKRYQEPDETNGPQPSSDKDQDSTMHIAYVNSVTRMSLPDLASSRNRIISNT